MNQQEYKLYYRRWTLSFEHHTSIRREPVGKTSWYPLREALKLTLPNGHRITMKQSHRLLWNALLVRASDLTVTPTKTMVGHVSLSEETGMSCDMVAECLDDLERLGWVRRKKRHNSSNITHLFLAPHPLGDDLPDPEDVSISPEDIGSYVKPASTAKEVRENPMAANGDIQNLIAMFQTVLPNHASFQKPKWEMGMTRSLGRCLHIAGSYDRCHTVLHHVLKAESERGEMLLEQMLEASNLSSYITANFYSWFSMYPHELPPLMQKQPEA